MGRGVTRSVIGLQNNQPEANRRITIRPHIRDGSYHPHENRDADIQIRIPKETSTEAIIKNLDKADKLREAVAVCIASYQQRLASWHNRRVKLCTFKAGELVLRKVFENTSNPVDWKFQPNWEGPYIMV